MVALVAGKAGCRSARGMVAARDDGMRALMAGGRVVAARAGMAPLMAERGMV
jgi:hypothetical protein